MMLAVFRAPRITDRAAPLQAHCTGSAADPVRPECVHSKDLQFAFWPARGALSSQNKKSGSGGGSAGSGGYDFQALAIAYIAVRVLTSRRLDWFELRDDVPTAVAAETGGTGDDIRIEFSQGPIEAQVKRGLDRSSLRDVVRRFAAALAADVTAEVLLIVDETTSRTIRFDLRLDLRRIAQGRSDELKPITIEVLKIITEAGAADPNGVAARIHVVELGLESEGAAHKQVAYGLLRELFKDEDHRKAWGLLIREGHRLQKQRGRRDRPGLLALLGAEGVHLEERPILAGLPAPPSAETTLRGETVIEATTVTQADPWHARIDEAVKLIDGGQGGAALRVLEQIEREARDSDLPPRVFYRLNTNLAACLVELNRPDEAEGLLRRALDYEESDTTARGSLAQVRLWHDDRADALQLAKQVLERTPESAIGWSIFIQASDEAVSEQAIPQVLKEEFQILAARALAANRRGDTADSIGLLRRALQRKRDPQLLVLLSQALFASDMTDDIERFLDEAIDALSNTDRPRLLEQALLLRGVVRTNRGEHEGAKEAFDQALRIQGHSWRVEAAVARNRLALGRPEQALGALEGIHSSEGRVEISLLKAFAYGRLARPDDARGCIDDVLKGAGDGREGELEQLLGATEASLHAGLLDTAEELLARLGSDAQEFRVPLFRARLAAEKGDSDKAKAEYRHAIEIAPPTQRRRGQFELGKYLRKHGEPEAAVTVFEDASVSAAPDDVRREYGRALYESGEASRLLALLDQERQRGALPVWALDLQARIALDRQDWRGAIKTLDELRLSTPKDAWVVLKLVEALLHEQERERAPSLLLELIRNEEADSDALMAAAHLLGDFEHPIEALDAAYRAVRNEPDNPKLRLAYLKSFLDAEKRHHPALKPTEIGPDTWVQLRSSRGDTREYLVVARGPADIQRGEWLATDERAAKLLGRKLGDRITFRAGAADETELEIVDIKAAAVRLFQQTLTEFRAWFPENTSLQSFPVGEGRLDELTPIISNLQGRANFVEQVFGLYDTHVLPLGMVAVAVGSNIRSVYDHRTSLPSGRLFVEAGDQASMVASYDAGASGHPVVLTLSALLTWHRLGMLDVLPVLFQRLLAPQSLVDELQDEARNLSDEAEHGSGTMAWVADRLVVRESNPEWFALQQAEIKTLGEWVREKCLRLPRPVTALRAADEERRQALGGSSHDALTLAKEQGAVIMADDFGLRRLARNEYEVQSFSSFAALKLAQDGRIIDEIQLARAATRLVGLNHDFVPVWPDMLYLALSDDQFQVTPTIIRLFDRLRGNRADTETAVRVGIAVLRKVALSVAAGEPVLEALAGLCFESLSADRGPVVFKAIASEIRRQTALLPLAQDRLIRTLSAFVAVKALGRSGLSLV
jgi:tetratricopeptide (TPR) repeat protein